jgi:hypothetical protein
MRLAETGAERRHGNESDSVRIELEGDDFPARRQRRSIFPLQYGIDRARDQDRISTQNLE